MNDGSPRPLPRKRLEQLIQGLRSRFSSSAEHLLSNLEQLSSQLTANESSLAEQLAELEQSRRSQREARTTEWDEALSASWDDAEMSAYKAVYDTAGNEGALRSEARQHAERMTNELKKRAGEIEKMFLRAKDAPLAKLKAFRAQQQELTDQLAAIAQATEAALVHRSLQPPDVLQSADIDMPANSEAALEATRVALQAASVASHHLTNHGLAKFFESAAWWGLCACLFVAVTAVIGISGLLPWLVAGVLGAIVSVALMLLSLIGIRPWLKSFAAAEYPKVQMRLQQARRLLEAGSRLAIVENDTELKRLAAKRDERFEQAKQWRDQEAHELTQRLDEDLAKLHATAAAQKQLASHKLTQATLDCDALYTQRLHEEWQQFTTNRDELVAAAQASRSKLQSEIQHLQQGGARRLRTATQNALRIVGRTQRWAAQFFPDWSRWAEESQFWPPLLPEPTLPLGSISLREVFLDSAVSDVDESQLHVPLFFSPLRDQVLTITAPPDTRAVGELARNLVMRALTTLPAGKTQICVIDPPGLGRDFGWLMHLGDFDPQLVSHRVWTQPGHIAKQLRELALAAEDFIQQSLRNQYRDIVEYNAAAGGLAEPYRVLVWSNFPSGLDDQSWRSLGSVLDSGARCGIIPILIVDPNLGWPSPEIRENFMRRGLHLVYDDKSHSLRANTPELLPFQLKPDPTINDLQAQQIIQEVGRKALQSNRIQVPLEQMLSPAETRWRSDSSQLLEIPIGQSGVGRVQSLKLGIGTAQHAIVAGKTGSGKSSLLHAIITSAALKYSPESLRLVLLDFKKGVEFQIYNEVSLAHADIIGIESHREFGLSALEYVDACMQRRGEAFRQAAVQDLMSWNRLHPERIMPRMLFVIDEFQELFVEDDKLSSQASLILDRIVRQGRSFGIHAILSSQTLAGAYSLPRTTLGQMSVRIALQCDATDAQIIFSDDNPAAARLRHPGQAVYNDAGGRIEGNQPMQIGWLTKEQQTAWLEQLPRGYQNQDTTTNRLGRCVVYDGNRAATWNSSNASLAIEQSLQEVNHDAIWCVVGESVAIRPAVVFPFTPQGGRNLLVVGGEDPAAASVLTAVVSSFVKATTGNAATPQAVVVQGAKPTDMWALKLPQLWQALPCELKLFDHRQDQAAIEYVHAILKSRTEDRDASLDASADAPVEKTVEKTVDKAVDSPVDRNTNERTPPAVLLSLLQLGRFRSLRRDDEYGLASFGETKLTPDKQLEEILRDGPNHGVFTVVWAENYSTVNRWLSRSALRELEIRMAMQMSSNDSTNLIDSVAASRLGEHVMLVYDGALGLDQKFRPFDTQSLPAILAWAANRNDTERSDP